MTLAEFLATLERRAAEAERMQAHAPVAAVLHHVAEELRTVDVDGATAPAPIGATPTPDTLLTIQHAAARLGVTPRWLYRHAGALPFVRRLSRRALRVSKTGLERWLERQR